MFKPVSETMSSMERKFPLMAASCNLLSCKCVLNRENKIAEFQGSYKQIKLTIYAHKKS